VALRAQMLDAADHALADGHLGIATGRRLRRLAAKVRRPPVHQTATTIARYHRKASRALARACRLLSVRRRGVTSYSRRGLIGAPARAAIGGPRLEVAMDGPGW
jgi:hypothetical protein